MRSRRSSGSESHFPSRPRRRWHRPLCRSRQFLPRLLRRARLPGDFPNGRPISDRDQSVVRPTGFSLAGNVPRNGTEWAARAWQQGERRLPGHRPLMGAVLTVQSPSRSPDSCWGTVLGGRRLLAVPQPAVGIRMSWPGLPGREWQNQAIDSPPESLPTGSSRSRRMPVD